MAMFVAKESCFLYEDLAKGSEIIIPAWNDIIHIASPPKYTQEELNRMASFLILSDIHGRSDQFIADMFGLSLDKVADVLWNARAWSEYMANQQERAIDLMRSPTPALLQNFGTIMTALDDVQDFTTTVGVLSRVLGRVFKPAELLALGAFTVGEFLNRLNLLNRLTGGEKAVVCRLVRELKKSSQRSTIKADVDKRMKRLFPSKGEMFEIAQTTDTLFGVGISLGAIVGLIEDAIFGALKGSPVRFRDWEITQYERLQMLALAKTLNQGAYMFEPTAIPWMRWAEAAANIVIAGEHMDTATFFKGLIASIDSGVSARCKEMKKAIVDSWEIISGKKATPPKKTTPETRQLLISLGSNPDVVDAWPVEGLGTSATISEIMDGYSMQSQKVLGFWRNKLGVSDEGLFLDACVKELGTHAAAMFCADDGVITESIDINALIYIHALEAGLNPPPDTSNEIFTHWHNWISDQMLYFDISVPTLGILKSAYQKFFVV